MKENVNVRIVGRDPWTGEMHGHKDDQMLICAETVDKLKEAQDKGYSVMKDGEQVFDITEEMLQESDQIDLLTPIAGG